MLRKSSTTPQIPADFLGISATVGLTTRNCYRGRFQYECAGEPCYEAVEPCVESGDLVRACGSRVPATPARLPHAPDDKLAARHVALAHVPQERLAVRVARATRARIWVTSARHRRSRHDIPSRDNQSASRRAASTKPGSPVVERNAASISSRISCTARATSVRIIESVSCSLPAPIPDR